ncbi:methylated-DNA--[protein]-cysteine S-methyltransferase [Pseudothauera lacus]|uniref:methylated-DNA--[protein]-cysteine S-methyltransferase n=1 Tax=Pseudothauera lacus TaxID=2136175 RepID=A0A2T4IHM4_9RHOO|nr:methylated-DNA--[protein]-cysteine S-methyltransferase [Pseudothauera lacus]PTD97274.1 cysteine methyltransferase [Pseudothauera lacus]
MVGEMCWCAYDSPLGRMVAVSRGGCLAGLYFDDQRDLPALAASAEMPANGLLGEVGEQLTDYFGGRRRRFELPLLAAPTAFQQRVREALLQVGAGDTCSYAALAAAIGQPRAARAVARALAANPLVVVVPCHRVVTSAGGLGGFSAGLPRKRALLALEGGGAVQ